MDTFPQAVEAGDTYGATLDQRKGNFTGNETKQNSESTTDDNQRDHDKDWRGCWGGLQRKWNLKQSWRHIIFHKKSHPLLPHPHLHPHLLHYDGLSSLCYMLDWEEVANQKTYPEKFRISQMPTSKLHPCTHLSHHQILSKLGALGMCLQILQSWCRHWSRMTKCSGSGTNPLGENLGFSACLSVTPAKLFTFSLPPLPHLSIQV